MLPGSGTTFNALSYQQNTVDWIFTRNENASMSAGHIAHGIKEVLVIVLRCPLMCSLDVGQILSRLKYSRN